MNEKLERRATAAGITVIPQSNVPPVTDALRLAIVQATVDNKTAALNTMKILDKQQALVNIVADLCKEWNMEDPSLYQLQFDDTKVQPPPIYITEENRDKMKDGDILKLCFSPQRMSQIIVDGFHKDDLSKKNMDRLATLTVDVTFVEHFVTQKGFTELSKFIVRTAKQGQLSAQSGSALSAFMDIMDHYIVTWETIEDSFLDSILWYVEDKNDPDILVVKSALSIIESAILNSSVGKSFAAESKIDVNHFISTLKTRNVETQVSCISLINTILSVSTPKKQAQIRKQLLSQPIRQLIWENIFTAPICRDMAYQLYSLQTRLFNLLTDRLNGPINTKDPAAIKEVNELRRMAFDDDVDVSGFAKQHTRVDDARDFTKLGFKIPVEPLLEFKLTPPGALALDCMAFFAHQYTQQFRQVVLENSRERADEQDCPFAQASVELTKLLSDILKIGEPPSEELGLNERTYYPMFFFKEKPFEEFFCVCIQRLTKTWKEMKASLSDFNKVLMVVREQITRALSEQPHTFDSLKTKLTNWSFAKIQEARQKELERKEEIKRQAKPILELREMIKPEIQEVIKQQRINRMIDGYYFKGHRTNKARNERYVYCKLSHNAKVLQHGNSSSDQNMPDTLQSISVVDIEDIKQSDDTKTRAKTIIIIKQGGEELQLNTDDARVHDVWLDGLHALTGIKEISSGLAKGELDELLSMEVKLRLLDAEGINFPDEPPPIPAPPSNFNFVT